MFDWIWMKSTRGSIYFNPTKLKQMETHVRTLNTANELLMRVSVSSSSDLSQKIKFDEAAQSIGYLEALCHMAWLRLLELIACLEHNFCAESKPVTYPRRVLSPFSPKGALESGFESELSPQPFYCQHHYSGRSLRMSHSQIETADMPNDLDTRRPRLRACSVSQTCLIERSTPPSVGEQPGLDQPHSDSGDQFEVLSASKEDVTIPIPPLDSTTAVRETQIQDSAERPCEKYDPCDLDNLQTKPVTGPPSTEGIYMGEHTLPHQRAIKKSRKRRFHIHRITRGKHWTGATNATRNCRSTPALSNVPPIYRILMRKPTRRLLLAVTQDTKGIRPVTDRSNQKPLNMERLRATQDPRLRWHARWLTSRVNKTTEADMEDLSTQDVSLHTTTPSSGAADSKKVEPTMTPAPFVLVRHKSRRQPTALTRQLRRHAPHRRSHPVIWRRGPRPRDRNSAFTLTVPPPRPHSFCVPYSTGLDRPLGPARGSHSESSSIDGDASDPEYRLWQTRVKSYLDAAAQADDWVRSQYGPIYLKRYLSPPIGRRQRPPGSGLGVSSSPDEGSPQVRDELLLNSTGAVDSTRLVLDCQEPLLNFWDDYQAPLYSNSSDTDGCEPVSTYAEEFPWDDIAASCLSDASQEDVFLREIQAAKPKSTSSVPPRSTATTPGDEVNSAVRSSTRIDVTEAPVYRQDTMELSTSTSVLFNQKSSSLDASFEVCSQSATTGESNNVDTHDSPASNSNSSGIVCGLRTHPDGGSQPCLDADTSTKAVQSNGLHALENQMRHTASCISMLESHFLVRLPTIGPEQQPLQNVETKHNYFNPYLTDHRKCQTLPRASAKRKRRQQLLACEACTTDVSQRNRLSATASLDELSHWSDRGPRLDILRFSRQRLLELRTLFSRLMQINPGKIKDAGSVTCEEMTLSHWQNSLSHVTHLAEANLQLLTDHTLGSVICSSECSHKHSPSDLSSSEWLNCPELKDLQMQWVQFTDQARNWLLQSYSQEATQQQLNDLKSRIAELNQIMQRVLVTEPVMWKSQISETQAPVESMGSQFEFHSASQRDCELSRQIHHCMKEIEEMGERVHQLREEFERHVIHSQGIARDSEHLPTANFVAWRDDNLVSELDQLTHELSANQQRLTSWLTMKSTSPQTEAQQMDEPRDSSDEQDWEHVDYPAQFAEVKLRLFPPRPLFPSGYLPSECAKGYK
ncbi:unnamed protein product [Echinostoma caproni]|uniref:SOAR domain-containing protein n=1 Tax=Echinostoma caproni TaxID=27848 RepID=A0A183A7S9_9TREM|nr:unnamed protein product [Echinostoma caproni]